MGEQRPKQAQAEMSAQQSEDALASRTPTTATPSARGENADARGAAFLPPEAADVVGAGFPPLGEPLPVEPLPDVPLPDVLLLVELLLLLGELPPGPLGDEGPLGATVPRTATHTSSSAAR
jgi:hypothetical protein